MPFDKGSQHPDWKGGVLKEGGYIYIYQPEHPRAFRKGKYVKRADLVLEAKLGRPLLPDEMAHHIDRVRDNDVPENLEAVTRSSHGRTFKGYLTGEKHPNWQGKSVCPNCGGAKNAEHKLCRSCFVSTGEASAQVKRGWETRKRNGSK
jgi:ribosomal protein L32